MKDFRACSLLVVFALELGLALGCGSGGGGGDDDAAIQPGADGMVSTIDGMPGLPDATAGLPDAHVGGTPDATPMLHGSPPLTPKGLRSFSVLNRDGTTRTEADLMGHPTVIWFYPAAFTAG